ncbi:nodulin-related protein 1-like [Dioscorea cayenensis subsp. rotundata]|uniref:Nodulin-related protein 1-like n=1 Tax=Dioscorea cayennensis subsp. rotundata TaxID=55577 RepID=A0AB40AVY2_DIOCR|nr:nodulin-related protein 1-like [Dioscorea cayenensis subsp. rotundata]
MNFSSILKAVNPDTKEDDNNSKSSSSELLGSAKVLSDAASAAYRHETDKIDKSKVADAAGDVLGAVSDQAKLKNTSIGQYVDKAETYLHSYGKPSTTPTTDHPPPATTTTTTEPTAATAAAATHDTTEPIPAAAAASEEEEEPKSGAGEYLKVAQGLFK